MYSKILGYTIKIPKILETSRARIIKFIESQGIESKKFLEKTGLKKGFVDKSHINSSASDNFLSKILEVYPKLSAEWLLTGKGSMLKEDTSKPINTPEDMGQIALLQQENSFLKEKITLLEENKILQAKEIKRLEEEIKRIKK